MPKRLRSLFIAAVAGLSLLGPAAALAAPAPFADEADASSLLTALERQAALLEGDGSAPLRLGDRLVSRRTLRETVLAFAALVREGLGAEAFEARLRERFELIEAPAHFTGYYLPRLEARRAPDDRFRFPLYARPPRPATGEAGPTRAQIEDEGALAGQGLELAWVADELERYLLMVQGSGVLRFEDGSETSVNYGGGNGHPYVSLGKLLVADGKIPPALVSVPAIRAYFAAHPEEQHAYLLKNPSYVFFKLAERGPFGGSGALLTPGRSIATDKALSPSGAIAYVRYARDGKTHGRFVCDQDTGSAIKGWGRADIYWGAGDEAGYLAGTLNATGSLTYLLIK